MWLGAVTNRTALSFQVGLAICYDMRFPELSLALAQAGAEILTYPSAFGSVTGPAHWEVRAPHQDPRAFSQPHPLPLALQVRLSPSSHLVGKLTPRSLPHFHVLRSSRHRNSQHGQSVLSNYSVGTTGRLAWCFPTSCHTSPQVLLRARAIETQCYVVAAAQCGRHHEKRASYGHSMVVDPWGTVVARCSEGPGLCLARIDLGYLRQLRQQLPVFQHRRSDLYGNLGRPL